MLYYNMSSGNSVKTTTSSTINFSESASTNTETESSITSCTSSSEHRPTSSSTSSSIADINLIAKSLISDGHVIVQGEKMSYIAKDFAEQLRLGSSRSVSPASSTSSKVRRSDIPQINPNMLDNLEEDCFNLSKSVDSVICELTQHLNKITAISVANTQTCNEMVDDLGACVDKAVHSMYALIAQCEELDATMAPVYQLAAKISSIKDILSALEANIH